MKFSLRQVSINTINLIGIGVLLLFAFLFTALVVFEEYRDFEREVIELKHRYLVEKKAQIRQETERVLRFIKYEYRNYRNRLGKEELQHHILDAVGQLYTDLAANRYIFIYRLDGTNVFDPNHPEIRGVNMMSVTDPRGVPILPRLIEKARRGGGFLSYIWEEPSTKRFTPKISYAEIFEPWEWLVGTGLYTSELEEMVEQKKERMKRRLIKYIMEILTLSAILFGFAFAGIKLINKIIRDEITTFSEFFKEAATRYSVINRTRIRIREFMPLVDYVNRMVETIHRRKEELRRLNLSLEEKVRQKTAKLRQQKEYSESLVKAQDAFIKTSIHEINTPLAVIMAQIDLLKLQRGDDRYIRKIEAAAKMIHTLYGDLSYLLRRHRVEYEKESVDAGRLLRERVEFFEEIARANHLTVRLEIEPCGRLCINSEELTRLVDNNLSNAIKYALPHTAVSVSLECRDGRLMLRFSNAAKEIEKIEKLFEPFYKERDDAEGFGLGLHLVKRICERNRIAVSLTHENNMVTFAYTFPEGGCDEDTSA